MWLFLVIERWNQIRRIGLIEKIKWTDRVSNEEVLQRVGEKRQLMNHIRERQAKWIGHVMRGDTLLKDILEGRIKGKKQSRRPRCKTLDWMMN